MYHFVSKFIMCARDAELRRFIPCRHVSPREGVISHNGFYHHALIHCQSNAREKIWPELGDDVSDDDGLRNARARPAAKMGVEPPSSSLDLVSATSQQEHAQ